MAEIINNFPDAEETNKPFRISNKKFLLTYKTHLDKSSLIEFFSKFKNKITNKPPPFIRIAHEVGKTNDVDYDHTHVVIDFGYSFRSENCRIFDFNDIHPNIKKITTNSHWEHSVRYLSKEDIENVDLKDFKIKGFETKDIWKCKSKQEALLLCKKPSDASGILNIFENKPITNKLDFSNCQLRPWQNDLLEILKGPVDDRKIFVYYDPVGNMGKSFFTKYLFTTFPNKCVFLTNVNYRDTARIISNELKSKPDFDTIIIDLPRDCENKEFIYSAIESLKNGFMTSNKYDSQNLFFNPCHIVIMSNFIPMIEKCSLDRWDIKIINDDFSVSPINIHEYFKTDPHLNLMKKIGKDKFDKIMNFLLSDVSYVDYLIRSNNL